MIRPERLWPVGIVAVLAVTVAANLVLLWAANQPGGAAVEPDYYRKALAWDSTKAIAARSDSLGWRLDAQLVPAAGGRTRVEASLLDRGGQPVRDVKLSVEAIHNLDPAHPVRAALAPDGPGFATTARLPHPGLWELRFIATRGGARFVTTLRRERAAAG